MIELKIGFGGLVLMMGLYGHRNLNDNLLQGWILNWNEQRYVDYVNSNIPTKLDELDKRLVQQIQFNTIYESIYLQLLFS
ncbi:hypothetical protein ACNA6I_17475 [Rossellomorea sp. FS2]|uniref:hypothetical protein n=1 Tax=Rossellomorea sp. FS2 TaxID=3391447 RepID=UPI003A4DEE8B